MFLYIKRDSGTKFTSLTIAPPPPPRSSLYCIQTPPPLKKIRGGVYTGYRGALPYKSDGNAWAVLKLQILVSLFGMETVLAGFVWTGGQTGGEKFLFCNKNGYVDWALLGDVNENYEKTIGLAWQ